MAKKKNNNRAIKNAPSKSSSGKWSDYNYFVNINIPNKDYDILKDNNKVLLNRIINMWAKGVVEYIKIDIMKIPLFETGNMVDSVNYKVYQNKNKFEIKFNSVYYTRFQDLGTTRGIRPKHFYRKTIDDERQKLISELSLFFKTVYREATVKRIKDSFKSNK